MKCLAKFSHIKQKLFDKFFNLSLATKLMIIIQTGILFIFLFLSVLMILLSQQNNLANQKRQGREFLNSGLNTLREEMQYISGISDYLGLASDIQSMMMQTSNGQNTVGPSDTLAAVSKLKYVVSIIIYDSTGRVLDYYAIDGSTNPLDQPVNELQHPLNRLMTKDKSFEWQYIGADERFFMERDFSPKLCLWKRVESSKDKNIIGAIAVSLDVRKLLDSGSGLGTAYRSIIIVNEKNEEVFNKTHIPLDSSTIAMLNALDPTVDNQVTIDKTQYLIFSSQVANTDLKLMYLFPFWDIQKDISAFAAYTIVAVALFMLLLIPLFMFITKSVTKPLKQLTASMEKFSHGDFASQVNFRYTDEVGRLGTVFNSMVSENKRLINSNYVLKLKEKEAELASLQSQINPHFLYNVVNSIQWLAVKNQDKEVAELIYSLGRIFRFSLGVTQKMWTVRQEIELLYNYLKLQKQCYGARFEYSVNIQNGVGEIYIPRLSIQPLVENSIVHGVESSSGKIQISVNVNVSEGDSMIHLEVYDNGPGIRPEILELLPDKIPAADKESKSQRNGLALKNIYDRLKITYDDQYSFVITSIPHQETAIKIVVPIIHITETIEEEKGGRNVQDHANR